LSACLHVWKAQLTPLPAAVCYVQDTWHREERLISSAMFELGVRIMDQKIQSQMQQPSLASAGATPGGGADSSQYLLSAVNSPFFGAGAGGGTTFLGAQREALARSTADAAVRGTPGPSGAGSGAAGGVGTPLAQGDVPSRKLF
jgi:hypothetical protein